MILKTIIAAAKNRGVPIMVQTYPADKSVLNQPLNAIIRSVAAQEAIPLVDQGVRFNEMLTQGCPKDELFLPDEHCTVKGYGVMARAVLEALSAEHIVPDHLPAEETAEGPGAASFYQGR